MPSSTSGSQRGVSLIEAIVSMVLIGLLAQGLVSLTKSSSASQGLQQNQIVAVNQMRAHLAASDGLCDTAPFVSLPGGGTVVAEVQGCDSTTSATVGGVAVTGIPRPISLSVTSEVVGGQLVVGGTWTTTP